MTATALPTFLDALLAALEVRAGLAGVNVFSAPVEPADLGAESIMFAPEVTVEQVQASLSSDDIEESFDVPGAIICFAAMVPGDSPNVAAKTVRDRACAIFEEVVDELAGNETVSGTVRDARTTEVKVTQGLAPEGQLGRWCEVQFTISAEAHTTP